MTRPQEVDPLLQWNRSARESAENALVSSMFEASYVAIKPIEGFVTWLLLGAAAVASFLLGNSDKFIPIVGQQGFLVCGLLLSASCLFGLLAKAYLLKAEIGHCVGRAVAETFAIQLRQHEVIEQDIQAAAQTRGFPIETGIRMDRVLSEFLTPMPVFVKFSVTRWMKKNVNNPQIAYLPRIKAMNGLVYFSFLQAISFLMFVIVGFVASVF